MQLREVAQALGLPVHEVIGRKVHLTEAGLELASSARAIAAEWDSLEQKIAAIQGLTRGRLRVAVVSTAQSFMPRLLGSFCAQHPQIDISLEVLNRDGVVRRLRDNLDDFCIMSMPPTDLALQDQVFMANPLVLIASSQHRWARRRSLELADLSAERFVLRERGSGTRMAVDAHFRRCRFKPLLRLELGSNEAIRESVAGNLGLAVISRHALPANGAAEGVVVLPVRGFPLQSRWHIVMQRGRQLSPIATEFRSHLLQAAGHRAPATT
jgi:DNA-binding transcriptional LysR family regulator